VAAGKERKGMKKDGRKQQERKRKQKRMRMRMRKHGVGGGGGKKLERLVTCD